MARSAQEQLDACDARIQAIEESGAQEYSIADRSKRDAELSTLYRERERLEMKVAATSGGGSMATLGQVDRPR